jgi:choline dehydrogenase-like flavoprotein
MLLDLREMPDDSTLEADVCVVGAGVAGVTLTRQLRGQGLTIVLLESGGRDYEEATQDLYAGTNVGMPYYPLDEARLRFFGGSTNVWGGRCAALEPIDFEKRSWVPHSGWPISRDDLVPYYQKAHQLLGLGRFVYDESLWAELRLQPPPFDSSRLITRFWRFDRMDDRFTLGKCRDLEASDDVRIVLHANAVRIQATKDANRITHVGVRTLEGRGATVRARAFVLASGGIENPRLLLASNDVEAAGIGNAHDQVGRCFMEHPHGRAGFLLTDKAYALWRLFQKRFRANAEPLAPLVLPSPKLQAERGILNTAITFKLQRRPSRGVTLNKELYFRLKHQIDPTRSGRRVWHAYRDVRGWLTRYVRPTHAKIRNKLGLTGLSAIVRAEQAPNPASRIALSDEKDALGIPRASLSWQLTDLDKHTVAVLAEVLSSELEHLGIGSMPKSEWLGNDSLQWPVDKTVGNHPIGGYHHLGTTRMSAHPKDGVVDTDCRVHGYDNLYVAGSSVFTTGGWANPNLTILALALRLAEHLAKRVRSLDVSTRPAMR